MEKIIIDIEEYSIACKEVLEIFKNIKEEDLEKIPNKEIEKLKKIASNDYEFTYNVHKNIKEQNVSKLAKAIIANFFIEYIANEEQKETVLSKQKYDLKLLEEEKCKKYPVKDVFASKRKEIRGEEVSAKLPMIIKKEAFWYKILKYIKKIFKV